MSRAVSYTTANVGYPVFCAEFDPYNRGYLVVGGGGGVSRSGVPNKITVLDVTSTSQLETIAEIDLSRDEDSPQSLASLAVKDGLVTFAGINSTEDSQKAGKNEHLRTFEVTYPTRKEGAPSQGSITHVSQVGLFNHPLKVANQDYQRILRLSPVQKRDTANKRIGAVATGLGKKNEVVVFDATTSTPSKQSVLARFSLSDGDEAVDLDVSEPEPSKFYVAWCTDYEVYLHSLDYDFSGKTSKSQSSEPRMIFQRPKSSTPGPRARLRCLRWLSPQHLLVLTNQPGDGGSELSMLRLNSIGDSAEMVLRKTLSSKVKAAIGLEVAHLDADPASGDQQIVVAVQAKGGSIPMFYLDYTPGEKKSFGQVSKFHDWETVPANVHKTDVTKICFTNFFAPRQPASSPVSVATKTQYLQLATVALGGSVAVCNIPLTTQPTRPSDTTQVDANSRKSPNVRWILSNARQERFTSITGRITIAIMVVVVAIALGVFQSIDPAVRERVFTQLREHGRPARPVPSSVQSGLPSFYDAGAASGAAAITDSISEVVVEAATSVSSAATEAASKTASIIHPQRLRDIFHRIHHGPSHASSTSESLAAVPSAIHIALDPDTDELHAVAHDGAESLQSLRDKGAKTFEELSEREQEIWKARLIQTGHYVESLPMTVLKGVLFSEYAGIVGGALRDAVLNN